MLTLAWWWMLAAAPLPWLVRRAVPPESVDYSSALKAPVVEEFVDLPVGRLSVVARRRRFATLTAIWILVLLAATRPQLISEAVVLPTTGRDLMLAVDLSGSMAQNDFRVKDKFVDRLVALKSVAKAFIDRRIGDRIGLILFGHDAYLQAPLTFDRRSVRTLLDESSIGLAGAETAIGDAIGLAIRTLDDAGVEEGRRVLILWTDGANTSGTVEPLQAAELAAKRHMVIYTIGILPPVYDGEAATMPVDFDEPTLIAIAEQTGGKYFPARQTQQFDEIYGILDQLEPAAKDEQGFRPVIELFYWPLAAAAMVALGAAAASLVPAGWRTRRALTL